MNQAPDPATPLTETLYRRILDTFTAHLTVIRPDGQIIYVNRAWEAFAEQNGDPQLLSTSIGQNYLTVCTRARPDPPVEALAGIQSVLQGQLPLFELEYPCHGPTEERWFLMRVKPLCGDPTLGALIVHTDITLRKQMERQQEAARNEAFLSAQREREIHALEELELGEPKNTPDRLAGQRAYVAQVYRGLLDVAVESKRQGCRVTLSPHVRALGHELARLDATPADVMDITLSVLKERLSTELPLVKQTYAEENRILTLELMGWLADRYRRTDIDGLHGSRLGAPP